MTILRNFALTATALIFVACSPSEKASAPEENPEPVTVVAPEAAAAETVVPEMVASPVAVPKIDELVPLALEGDLPGIKAALENGFKPDTLDEIGRSLLLYAAFNGHTPVVKSLLKAGANVNLTDSSGSTALMFAASGPFTETVKFLLENGASINAVDSNEHFSALMWAASEGQAENVKLLLEYKADLSLKDIDGDNAESFAAQNNHADVVAILKAATLPAE